MRRNGHQVIKLFKKKKSVYRSVAQWNIRCATCDFVHKEKNKWNVINQQKNNEVLKIIFSKKKTSYLSKYSSLS